jgi:hypothetical protein
VPSHNKGERRATWCRNDLVAAGPHVGTSSAMFTEPTINDFLDRLRSHLDGEIENAKLGIAGIEAKAARSGISGNAIVQIFAETRTRFESGINFALAELSRTIERTALDRRELRQLAVQSLTNFAIQTKSITNMEKYKGFGGAGLTGYIEDQLSNFDKHLQFCIRQFDTGFLDPLGPRSRVVSKNGEIEMPLQSLMNDRVTFVKKDGTVIRSDIPAAVTSGQIITSAADPPIQVGDHFLRQLPNGLVEDFIVNDPGYMSGIAGAIAPHYQVKVRRSDAPAAAPQTIIGNFHGPNSRMNVNSTDSSVNVVSGISSEQLADFVSQLRATMFALPTEQQSAMAEQLAVLEVEAAGAAPSQSKIRSALRSIKTITEGAATNPVASGIGALISKLLGAG